MVALLLTYINLHGRGREREREREREFMSIVYFDMWHGLIYDIEGMIAYFPYRMMDAAYFVGRNELLSWLNDLLSLGYTKVEQTCSGMSPSPLLWLNLY